MSTRPPKDESGESTGERVAVGLAKIGTALRSHAWQAAGARGLTPTQGQILALLRARGPSSPSALADALAVSRPTVTDAVTALVDKRLAARSRAAGDARAQVVTLTAAGRREAERAAAWPDFLLGAVDALAPDEQAAFLRALVKMIRTLQERGEIPVARMCVDCRYFSPHAHADRARPHHCGYVDAPFGDAQLRLECAEHEPAPLVDASRLWRRFCEGGNR